MNNFKTQPILKAISILLVITFLNLDIAWAYPADTPQNNSLSVQSINQLKMFTAYGEAFKQLEISMGGRMGSVLSVSKFLFEDGMDFNYLRIIENELGRVLEGVEVSKLGPLEYLERLMQEGVSKEQLAKELPETMPKDEVLVIPYLKDGERHFVFVARKESASARKELAALPGEEWLVTDELVSEEYVLKELIWDYERNAPVQKKIIEKPGTEESVTEPVQIEEMEVDTVIISPGKPVISVRKRINIKAIVTAMLVIVLTPLTALAGDGGEITAGLFITTHPILFWGGIGVIAVGLFFAAWRILFPVKWYMRRLKSEDLHVRENAISALKELGDPNAVPALIKALSDELDFVRESAAIVLGKIGDSRAVLALIKMLNDKDAYVRRRAVWALSELGDSSAVPALIKTLGDGNFDVRENAADALGEIGKPAVPALAKALFNEDNNVRGNAAIALGKIGDPRVVPALIKALGNKDREVRDYAASALRKLGDPRAIPTLTKALDDRNSNIRENATDALGKTGKPAVPALVKALGNKDSIVRKNAADALGEIGDSQAVPALIKALTDELDFVRYSAVIALDKIGDPSAVPALTKALDDEYGLVRENAAIVLKKLGDSQVVSTLIKALDDEDMYSRKNAANELAKIGKPAIPALVKALSNRNSDVRICVAFALEKIGDSSAVPALIKALSGEDMLVRGSVAFALGEISDPSAVSALIRTLDDMDVFVREKAAEALGKIGDSSAVPALIKALNDKYGFISRNADGTLSGEKRSVCESAAIALIKIGEPAVPALVKALFYGDSNVRENIAVALKKSGDSRVVSVLIEALGSKNSDVRKNAAYVLGEIGDPCAVPALTKALDDEDGLVHESAAIALGEIGDSQAVPALIKALDDKDMYSRKNSANELAKIGKPTVDPLIKVLSNENEDVRLSAVVVLIKIGEPAVPALKRALGDKDSNVRKNAAYVLKKLGDTSEVPALIKELSNKHSRVRENAADMLGEIGDPRAVFALIKVLGDVERSVREKATNALAKIGKRAAQALIKALGNADNCVRKNAAVALGKIGAPLAVRALIETLSDVDSGVRKNAAVALGELSDPRAVRALTKALDDEDIRSVAADALKKIRNKKVVPMLTKPLSDVDGGLRRNAAYVLKKIDQPREKDGRYDQKPGGSPEDVWKKITGNETLKALAANGKLTVKKYREVDSSVSESTNRRDFRKLVEEGKLLPVGRVKEGNTYRFTVPARPAFELDYEEILSEDGPWNYGFLIPHVRRATAIGMRVGEELGLSEERLKLLEYVLLLHDVGAGIRGRYPDVFSSMTGKVEESFRKVFPSKKYISLKLALDDLMGHKAESEGLDIATADDDTRNRLLEKVLEGSLAREMTPEEKEVAYSMRGVAENSLRILKKQGIEVSKDLKAIIRYHNDYNGFKTEEGLTLSEEEAKLLITIMYIADVFEHGNNYHSRKGDIAPFGKTVAFMESKFAGEEIKDRRAIDALCSLLGREDKVILNTAANGRATVAIGPEDKQFMEEQALRSASRLMMKEKGKKFTRERKADGAPGQLLKIKAERLIVINDLHSELAALDAIINEVESDPGIYDEIRSGRTQIVLLGDFMQTMNEKDFEGYRESSDEFRWMSYESYKRSAGKRVYDLIVRVAELKIKYGDSFHVLPGNSELGFLYKRAYTIRDSSFRNIITR